MKLRSLVVVLSAAFVGTAAPGFAEAARDGGHRGGSHFSGGGGHYSGGRTFNHNRGQYRGGHYRGGYSGFGLGLGLGLIGGALAAPYVASPYYGYPAYAPAPAYPGYAPAYPAYAPGYPPEAYAPYGYAPPYGYGYGYGSDPADAGY